MRIYVAGPYTQGTFAANMRAAIDAADRLLKAGHAPFVPHTMTFAWDVVHPNSYETWLDLCMAWVTQCEGLLRLPGHSPGADKEVLLAKELKIPVWTSILEVPRVSDQ